MIDRFRGDNHILSNYYPGEFIHPSLGAVASGEHAYNALKTLDARERAAVLSAETPNKSKAIGRRVTLREGWDVGLRMWAMRSVVAAKFTLDSGAGAFLLGTEEEMLIEGNTWHDTYFGRCSCDRCGGAGQNMLGELLMERRAMLRS